MTTIRITDGWIRDQTVLYSDPDSSIAVGKKVQKMDLDPTSGLLDGLVPVPNRLQVINSPFQFSRTVNWARLPRLGTAQSMSGPCWAREAWVVAQHSIA